MSDLVTSAIITTSGTILVVILTAMVNARANRKQNEAITTKVEAYHKEVNGKMEKLLETKEALGLEKGKAEEKENQKKSL